MKTTYPQAIYDYLADNGEVNVKTVIKQWGYQNYYQAMKKRFIRRKGDMISLIPGAPRPIDGRGRPVVDEPRHLMPLDHRIREFLVHYGKPCPYWRLEWKMQSTYPRMRRAAKRLGVIVTYDGREAFWNLPNNDKPVEISAAMVEAGYRVAKEAYPNITREIVAEVFEAMFRDHQQRSVK